MNILISTDILVNKTELIFNYIYHHWTFLFLLFYYLIIIIVIQTSPSIRKDYWRQCAQNNEYCGRRSMLHMHIVLDLLYYVFTF